MRLEAHGTLYLIKETRQVSARFQVREFVVEIADNPQYPQFVQFQLSGARCEALDNFSVGDEVTLQFNLRGREWKSPSGEVKYFNSLDVWRIEPADGRSRRDDEGQQPSRTQTSSPPDRDEPPPLSDDDIPF